MPRKSTKTYTVWVKLELEKTYEIKATDECDAQDIAEEMAMNDDISTFDCTEVSAYEVEEND